MMNKEKRCIKSRYKNIILALVILLTLLHIIYLFVFIRDGHHSDEAWSYGFANSFYDPYLTIELGEDIYDFSDARLRYVGEWTSSEVFRSYLAVDPGQEFSFLSVIDNKKGDASPPLYEIILHCICSFFPNEFSWWFAFSINIFCYVFILVSLYLITNQLNSGGNGIASLVTCLLYGISSAGIGTALCLRIYSLLTLLYLLYVYLLLRFLRGGAKRGRFIIFSVALVFLGALTHYFFLAAAFFLVLFSCFGLLIKKRFADMFTVGVSALSGVILFFAFFPYGFFEMFNEKNAFVNEFFHFGYILTLSTNLFFKQTIGLDLYITSVTFLKLAIVIFWLLILSIAFCFLFRKEYWIKIFYKKIKGIICFTGRNIKFFLVGDGWICGTLLFTLIAYFLFASKYSSILSMGKFAIRYFYIIIPLFFSLLFSLGIGMCIYMRRRVPRLVYIGVCFLLMFLSIATFWHQKVTYPSPYEFRKEGISKISELTVDKNVIVICDSGWNLEWLSVALIDSEKFYLIYADDTNHLDHQLINLEQYLNEDTLILVYSSIFPNEDMLVDTQTVEFEFGDYNYSLMMSEREFLNEIIGFAGAEVNFESVASFNSSYEGALTIYKIKNI